MYNYCLLSFTRLYSVCMCVCVRFNCGGKERLMYCAHIRQCWAWRHRQKFVIVCVCVYNLVRFVKFYICLCILYIIGLITAMDMQFSSTLFGNLTTNFEPALSSLSLSGRKRQTTLMLSSAGISRSADISISSTFFFIFTYTYTVLYNMVVILDVIRLNLASF